jgi:hypothetical protein
MDTSSKIKFGIKIFFVVLIGGTLFGFGTMYLWNWLVPALFNGPTITFWQTIGLIALSKIFFSGFGRGGSGGWKHKHRWKERMRERVSNMSPEEREKFKRRLKEKCGPFWQHCDDDKDITG